MFGISQRRSLRRKMQMGVLAGLRSPAETAAERPTSGESLRTLADHRFSLIGELASWRITQSVSELVSGLQTLWVLIASAKIVSDDSKVYDCQSPLLKCCCSKCQPRLTCSHFVWTVPRLWSKPQTAAFKTIINFGLRRTIQSRPTRSATKATRPISLEPTRRPLLLRGKSEPQIYSYRNSVLFKKKSNVFLGLSKKIIMRIRTALVT